jgi:alpha-beta hydrolase superfamily lysophospholipase
MPTSDASMPVDPSRPQLHRRAAAPALRRAVQVGLLALAAAGLATGCASLDEKQREWIFQPTDRTWSGGLAAAQGMAEVWIPFTSAETGEAVRLHGLWLPQADAAAPVLLYLHGARWDVRGSAHRMRRMHELGYAVLGIDYRGFGQSSKALPSEDFAHEDALAAWRWLAGQHPGVPRHLFGHSLGGAIAVRLAAEVPDAAGLIVEGSFPSMAEVVGSFKWGWLPVSPLITQRFDAASRIGRVRAPVLVVHGSEDQLISPDLGRALYERAPAPKRWLLVDGGSHHNTNSLGQPQYREAVAALFGVGLPAAPPRLAGLSGAAAGR